MIGSQLPGTIVGPSDTEDITNGLKDSDSPPLILCDGSSLVFQPTCPDSDVIRVMMVELEVKFAQSVKITLTLIDSTTEVADSP
jgi:hypothetical protein